MKIRLISGSASYYLAQKIAKRLNISLVKTDTKKHNDGEIEPSIEESIKGKPVFILQSTFAPGDNIIELCLLIDAAKRASASKIIVVIPYFGYARSDRKPKPRIAIGAKAISKMIENAGATRIVTMDLHADQIQGFFEIPVDHLYASYIFIPYIKNLNLENIIVVSPDKGGTERATKYASLLNSDVAVCYKNRPKPGVINDMKLIGDVSGKNVILVDDLVDTAGTLVRASDLLIENGAKSVRAFCPHGVLSGDAISKINDSSIMELLITDSIPYNGKGKSEKIKVLSTTELLSRTIKRIKKDKSISSLFLT